MASDHTIGLGEHVIGVRDWGGEGPPLMLLPGAGRSVTDWEPAVPRLVAHHRVVGVDLPGHGASSEPDRWDWDVAVAFVEQVKTRLDLDGPFVCGHSLGGMVAARYGQAHPDAPGVVNVDGHGLGGPSTPQAFHDARAKMLEQLPPPLPEGAWVTKPSRRFLETLPDMGPELFAIYRDVRCPLLIFNCTSPVGAPLGAAISDAYRQALAADLDALQVERPTVEVATIDAGHDVHLEQPVLTADVILEFTARGSTAP